MYKFLILYLFLIGCGSEMASQSLPNKELNEEFKPYYFKFTAIILDVELTINKPIKWNKYIGEIKMVDKMSDKIIGLCKIFNETTWEIDISNNFWVSCDTEDKKILMYHELSHCILGLNHSKDSNTYMYPTIFSNIKNADEHVKNYLIDYYSRM